VIIGWRKLDSKELHNLYSSPNIITMIKLRRMRWMGQIEPIWVRRNMHRLAVGKLEGKETTRKSKTWFGG
jgi:hypothetical protein